MNRIARFLLYRTQKIIDPPVKKILVILENKSVTQEQNNDLEERIAFYLPGLEPGRVRRGRRLPARSLLVRDAIICTDQQNHYKTYSPWFTARNCFDVDRFRNPVDGWEWVRLANYFCGHRPDIESARKTFVQYVEKLKNRNLKKCYLFGTGPSLATATERDWSDGYRVVCNTIVRDPELWHRLKPDLFVAGDAIYHFGHTRFARSFRRDALSRLKESDTLFLYPEMFDIIVRREMSDVADKLVPVPSGGHQDIHADMTMLFGLPRVGNVLPLLLLPLGCTLSKDVYLWGFDGRAPADTESPFWANSNKHTYLEFMPDLKNAHPRFFDHYVPESDKELYVRSVHGDALDERLEAAERLGYTFTMMHKSWTKTLQKRFRSHDEQPPRNVRSLPGTICVEGMGSE